MSQGEELRRFIARTLVLRWWAVGTSTLILALGLGSHLLLGAAVATAWTGRGDLSAPVLLAGFGAVGLALAIVQTRRALAEAGSLPRCAKAIGQAAGPLAPTPGEDRQLRRDIYGAFELVSGGGRAGSVSLVRLYVDRVQAQMVERRVSPWLGIRPMPWRHLAAYVVVSSVLFGIAMRAPRVRQGLRWLANAEDARTLPRSPAIWAALDVTLRAPAYTGRPVREVPNPTGAMRAVAGTEIEVSILPRNGEAGGVLVVASDAPELASAGGVETVPLEHKGDSGRLVGRFVLRGSGNWRAVLVDRADDEPDADSPSSAPFALELEPDRPPEIEVTPPRLEGGVRDTDTLDIRWHATDDFGVRSVALVYQLADGSTHRLPAQLPPASGRSSWRHHTSWELAEIPLQNRKDLLYWLEVRDNDPGLGFDPVPAQGKLTRSATLRLSVDDEQAEHRRNILTLRELRGRALDILAERMLAARTEADANPWARQRLFGELHANFGSFLAQLAESVDALSVDTIAAQRDAVELAGIHRRLHASYQAEDKLHLRLGPPAASPGAARSPAAGLLLEFSRGNGGLVAQLEDEIIRLDDLVDGLLLTQLEVLVARLETTQRKIVDLLEQLKAGDESVRGQLEQLEQRRRDDLRRLSELRSMLQQEVEQEFMNLDAFAILQEMAAEEALQARLERGEVDQALEQARSELGDVQRLRSDVMERASSPDPANPLSQEARERIALLRELSQLQDEQSTLHKATAGLRSQWRAGVADEKASGEDLQAAGAGADAVGRRLDRLNDAHLGRDGRAGLADARGALDRLRTQAEGEAAPRIDLIEATQTVDEGLERAIEGAEASSAEARDLKQARTELRRLQAQLERGLPQLGRQLDGPQQERVAQQRTRQFGLRDRTRALLDSERAGPLPDAGRRALRGAGTGMGRSLKGFAGEGFGEALGGQKQALDGIRRAIESLRRGSPPPPTASSGTASTEAERDRTLRDELLDAMKEEPDPRFAEPVRRYYEELLR